MEYFAIAFESVVTVPVLFYTLLGVAMGMFIGALPGLTATMGVAILLPMTFWLEPSAGLGMLLGIYNSAIFAGGISAILLNIPGTPASISSTFDGYAITKRGEPRLALWINTVFSVIGGLIGLLLFAIASFPIARFALKFGPPEYAMTAIFGLSMMVAVSGKSIVKGIFSGFLGLGISVIGMDAIWAVQRYTFGKVFLLDGISYIPIMIGLFGMGEALKQLYDISKNRTVKAENGNIIKEEIIKAELLENTGRKRLSFSDFWKMKTAVLFSSVASVFIGAVPGTGGDIAGLVSWTQSKNFSKDRENYGKGSEEGLAVTCVANNACIGGAMTTMLSLGIPGDSVTAILIGALMMYNYVPGPLLFKERPDMVMVIIILLFFCNIFILFLGNLSSKIFAKVITLPRSWISTAIIGFSLVGSFALQNNPFDVVVCFIFGVIGFLLIIAEVPTSPLILALILGRMIESNLSRSLLLSKGSYSVFFTRPISAILIVLIISSLTLPVILDKRAKKKDKK